MRKLLKIYSGVPLKYYFGKNKYRNFEHYFPLDKSQDLIEDLKKEFKEVCDSADYIFENILEAVPQQGEES